MLVLTLKTSATFSTSFWLNIGSRREIMLEGEGISGKGQNRDERLRAIWETAP